MPKIKKIKVLPPRIKEIDEYPEQARSSTSELESRFSESSEKDDIDISEENESLIESTQPILDSASPKVRTLPLQTPQQTQQPQTQEIPQVRQTTTRTSSEREREAENRTYTTASLSSSEQETQRNYTQTSSRGSTANTQFNPNRSPLGSTPLFKDPRSVNINRDQVGDNKENYSEVKTGLEEKKQVGRRPWEA